MFEFEFIEWLRSQVPVSNEVRLGVGDDAAVLAATSKLQVLTTDLLLEGVHFDLSSASYHQVGRKALAVSLSDVAAMGAIPSAAVLNFALPKKVSFTDAQALFLGALDLARELNVAIVGGDTNRWNQGLVAGSTVLGRLEHPGWKLSGAKAGDRILVSGTLGGSLQGKHLDFTPRCALAGHLASRYPVHAATDISDSLTIDLAEICLQSKVGGLLQSERIPLAEAAWRQSAHSGRSPLEHALFDGEDFELLLCVPPEQAAEILSDPTVGSQLTEIGVIQAGSELQMQQADGAIVPLPVKGYEH